MFGLELKKYFRSRTNLVISICMLIYISVALAGSVSGESYLQINDKEEVYEITGIDAIREKRKDIADIEGMLTQEKLDLFIQEYKENVDAQGELDDIAYAKGLIK